MQIGMIAGEASGDLLGAGLIRELRAFYPYAQFEGIGGAAMQAEGFKSHYPIELLSVVGIVEIAGRYRRLKRCHKQMADYFLQNPPAVFIGIDAPEFNLPMEQSLKAAGIRAVHYVSPSVWAWRQYRLRAIARACDVMLILFPFEQVFYQKHNIPVRFVGHPLADQIPEHVDKAASRRALGLASDGQYIALLPGSRLTEVNRLSEPFLQTARWLLARQPQLQFLVPLATPETRQAFEQHIKNFAADLPIHLYPGQSRAAMAAADAVLLASGTATLECLLLKRPMVIAYRLSPLTYWLAKRFVHIPYFSLPNLLAGKKVVPELLQTEVNADNLGALLLDYLNYPEKTPFKLFGDIHRQLKQNADQRAAQAVIELLDLD